MTIITNNLYKFLEYFIYTSSPSKPLTPHEINPLTSEDQKAHIQAIERLTKYIPHEFFSKRIRNIVNKMTSEECQKFIDVVIPLFKNANQWDYGFTLTTLFNLPREELKEFSETIQPLVKNLWFENRREIIGKAAAMSASELKEFLEATLPLIEGVTNSDDIFIIIWTVASVPRAGRQEFSKIVKLAFEGICISDRVQIIREKRWSKQYIFYSKKKLEN